MEHRRLRAANDVPGAGYRVVLSLGIADAQTLWEAAAERALAMPGMTLSDVIDTIGPREDPSIVDCLAMLTAPAAVPGCVMLDYSVRELREDVGRAVAMRLPVPPSPRTLVQATGNTPG